MQIQKLETLPPINPNVLVKVTEMGNVVEVQYMSRRNNKQTIQMLDGGEQFMVCSTGEIKDVTHHTTRKDNRKGLYKTFANARALINTNVTDVLKVRWCTLTYADNMTDPRQLYKDFRDFNKRFQRYCQREGLGHPEYIVMMEPQGRGAWHAHLLYIWQDRHAPYIPNSVFAEIWGHGFVKIKRLANVDNVGAYLTAYLGDMELSECDPNNIHGEVKQVEILNDNGEKVKKCIIKGARLNLYPADFKMIRHSTGIKKPNVDFLTQEMANKKVLGATKTYESAYKLIDEPNEFESYIVKQQYNKVRENAQ